MNKIIRSIDNITNIDEINKIIEHAKLIKNNIVCKKETERLHEIILDIPSYFDCDTENNLRKIVKSIKVIDFKICKSCSILHYTMKIMIDDVNIVISNNGYEECYPIAGVRVMSTGCGTGTIITFINIKESNRDKWNEDEIAPEIQKMKTICKNKKEVFDELCTILDDYIGIFEDEYEEEYQNSFE